MSNSIWKTPDQKPESFDNIAFYVEGYLYSGYYKPQYNQYGIFGASKVEKWCYTRELSSYILVLETELERTRKALDKVERLEKENEAMREEFEVWHGNHKCVLEDKERLQKAVDKALDTLDYVSNEKFATGDGDFFEEYEEMHKAIKQDIDEIKQLIKEQ